MDQHDQTQAAATRREAVVYGLVVTCALFFIGWVTGMGGSLLPNLGFSILMGVFAGGLFILAKRLAGRKK